MTLKFPGKSTRKLIYILALIWTISALDAQEQSLPERIFLNPLERAHTGVAVTWRNQGSEKSQFIQWTKAYANPITIEAEAHSDRKSDLSSHHTKIASSNQDTVHYEGATSIYNSYRVAITDLTPGQMYLYRVGNNDQGWSEWIQFELPSDDPDSNLSFIYMGDPQSDLRSQWSRTIRQAYRSAPNAAFILYAGDLVNRGYSDSEWHDFYRAGDFIHRMVPSIMTPGNHEYEYPILSPLWRSLFTLPKNGPEGYKVLEGACYYVDYPAVRVISLDGTTSENDRKLRKVQAKWLESVLKETTQKWIILTLHQPFYSTKSTRDNPQIRRAFQPLVEKYGVDLVLQGHDHAYGRGMLEMGNENPGRTGTMFVVSVSGPKQYEVDEEKSWMQRKGQDTQLYQIIDIEGNALHYKCYTTTGKLFDAFRLDKKQNGEIELTEVDWTE